VILQAAKRVGTVVNRDTFKTWNAKFLADQQALQPVRAASSRPTGRQLFEQDASMIMSDDVFIKKMEASLGSALPEDEPPVSAQPAPLTFVPLPQSSDPLLSDPSNQYLFDSVDDDEILPDSDDEEPKKREKEEKPKPAAPESKQVPKQETKPAAKAAVPSSVPKSSSPKPAAKGKSSKK
jgi:hypothetical protein